MSTFRNRFYKKKSATPEDPISELKKIVNGLTRNPNLELDDEKMKKIKLMCKSCPGNIPHLYHFLMIQLRKNHAEVRFIVLLAINDFFTRSHQFRKLLENDFEEFIELTVETKTRKPLPPPKSVAERLKSKALHFVKEWYQAFGADYCVIKNAYSYLRSCKKINFGTEQNSSRISEHTQNHPSGSGTTEIFRKRKEMEEHSEEIFTVLTQMERCFQMLLPTPDDLFSDCYSAPQNDNISDSSQFDFSRDQSDIFEENSLRQHGIMNRSTVITIDLNSVPSLAIKEDTDSEPILANLRDMYNKVLNLYLPMVLEWREAFRKESGCTSLLKRASDLKIKLESKIEKYEKLKQNMGSSLSLEEKSDDLDSDDSGSDFEEVMEKEGYEATVPELEDANVSAQSLPGSLKTSGTVCQSAESGSDENAYIGDESNLPSTSHQSESVPDWQDPVLLAQLELETGVNLKMPDRDRRKKSKLKEKHQPKQPARTNLKKHSETIYVRLHKKLRKLKRLGKK